MKKSAANSGFSLIELIIAAAILMVLSSMVWIGAGAYRRKETDKFAGALCLQIRLMQTTTMAKTGSWRLCLYEEDGRYYCVREHAQSGKDDCGGLVWEEASKREPLGYTGAVVYEGEEKTEGGAAANIGSGRLIRVWRFDRDTGACIEGAGALRLSGLGKAIIISVYRESGKVEAAVLRE